MNLKKRESRSSVADGIFVSLPQEIEIQILTFLSLEDICLKISCLNKRWFQIANSSALWKNMHSRFLDQDEKDISGFSNLSLHDICWRCTFKCGFLKPSKILVLSPQLQNGTLPLGATNMKRSKSLIMAKQHSIILVLFEEVN